jgi:hypothetical protein
VEVGSDYTKSHIVPTSEQDLLHYLCGRTIVQTNAEEAHPPMVGQGGFDTCIARRAQDAHPERNGDKVLAAYYAAAGGNKATVLAALKKVRCTWQTFYGLLGSRVTRQLQRCGSSRLAAHFPCCSPAVPLTRTVPASLWCFVVMLRCDASL